MEKGESASREGPQTVLGRIGRKERGRERRGLTADQGHAPEFLRQGPDRGLRPEKQVFFEMGHEVLLFSCGGRKKDVFGPGGDPGVEENAGLGIQKESVTNGSGGLGRHVLADEPLEKGHAVLSGDGEKRAGRVGNEESGVRVGRTGIDRLSGHGRMAPG